MILEWRGGFLIPKGWNWFVKICHPFGVCFYFSGFYNRFTPSGLLQ